MAAPTSIRPSIRLGAGRTSQRPKRRVSRRRFVSSRRLSRAPSLRTDHSRPAVEAREESARSALNTSARVRACKAVAKCAVAASFGHRSRSGLCDIRALQSGCEGPSIGFILVGDHPYAQRFEKLALVRPGGKGRDHGPPLGFRHRHEHRKPQRLNHRGADGQAPTSCRSGLQAAAHAWKASSRPVLLSSAANVASVNAGDGPVGL